jgi:hypothetical protein
MDRRSFLARGAALAEGCVTGGRVSGVDVRAAL